MQVIVVGAGIGGLLAALSLYQVGIEVQVYESVPEIRALGVGINLLPMASAFHPPWSTPADPARSGARSPRTFMCSHWPTSGECGNFGQWDWRC